MRVCTGAMVGLYLMVATASAQDTPRAAVAVLGGVTFGEATAPVVAAQGAVRAWGPVQVIGEAGHMRNVITEETQAQFDIVEALLGLGSGEDADVDGRMSATYFSGGLRWSPTMGRIAPFAEGHIGAARLRLSADATLGGADVSDEVEMSFREEDREENALLLAAGGGVTTELSRSSSLDVGYRFSRIRTEEPRLSIHTVYAAFRFRFQRR